MQFCGFSELQPNEPYAILLNSWGDAHGRLKDFDNGEDLPIGTLRIRRKDVEKHLRANETYVFANLKGFPGQKAKIEKEFDISAELNKEALIKSDS